MTGTELQSGDQFVDTSFFVVIENENEYCDFVTIDEDALFDAVVIDLSQIDFVNSMIVDFNEDSDSDSDSFVTIDEDQVFISDFKEDDF